ncbi:MAG: hypothetical protein SGPRY_004059 [Prymnesium sp.]
MAPTAASKPTAAPKPTASVDGKGAQQISVSSIVQELVTCAAQHLADKLWASEHKRSVRCVAQVSVDRVDRTKLDPHVATLVVVEVVTEPSGRMCYYRLACDAGVITTVYNRSDIRHSSTAAVDAGTARLRAALECWRGLPKVGIRAAMRTLSRVTNGQGMRRCSCTYMHRHVYEGTVQSWVRVQLQVSPKECEVLQQRANPTTTSACSPLSACAEEG